MPSIRLLFTIIALCGLSGRLFGLDEKQITFHVTAVRSEDAPDVCPDSCNATRFAVEGHSETSGESTEYVLECVEIEAFKPSPHFVVVCARLHVHNDYKARLRSDWIAFGDAHDHSPDEPVESAYHIISEKEVNKKK